MIKKSKLNLLLVFALLVFKIDAQQGLGKMKITIKDKYTNNPIINTTYTLIVNSNDTAVYTADTEGEVITKAYKAGSYNLEVNCKGYLSVGMLKVLLGEDKTTFIVFSLTPSRPLTKKESLKLDKVVSF